MTTPPMSRSRRRPNRSTKKKLTPTKNSRIKLVLKYQSGVVIPNPGPQSATHNTAMVPEKGSFRPASWKK
jgi:hypothetical protein